MSETKAGRLLRAHKELEERHKSRKELYIKEDKPIKKSRAGAALEKLGKLSHLNLSQVKGGNPQQKTSQTITTSEIATSLAAMEKTFNKKKIAAATKVRTEKKDIRIAAIMELIYKGWVSNSPWHTMSARDARTKMRIYYELSEKPVLSKNAHRDIQIATERLAEVGKLPIKFEKKRP